MILMLINKLITSFAVLSFKDLLMDLCTRLNFKHFQVKPGISGFPQVIRTLPKDLSTETVDRMTFCVGLRKLSPTYVQPMPKLVS